MKQIRKILKALFEIKNEEKLEKWFNMVFNHSEGGVSKLRSLPRRGKKSHSRYLLLL